MNKVHRWLCRSAMWRKGLEEKIVPRALKGVNPGDNILEVGPGPGLTTDILRQRFAQVTAVEIDHQLAESLKRRMQGLNVKVVEGDATNLPFESGSFTGAVSFTMLHHVPSAELQNRLLAEVYRTLQPGGVFVGTDSTWSLPFQLIHFRDTMVVIDPDTFGERLEAAGFREVQIERARNSFVFRARHPWRRSGA